MEASIRPDHTLNDDVFSRKLNIIDRAVNGYLSGSQFHTDSSGVASDNTAFRNKKAMFQAISHGLKILDFSSQQGRTPKIDSFKLKLLDLRCKLEQYQDHQQYLAHQEFMSVVKQQDPVISATNDVDAAFPVHLIIND